MSSPSRLRALRPYLGIAFVPVAIALLVMSGRLALLLGVMWVALVLTVGMAATSQRPERPNTYDPRGRLHG